MPWTNKNNLPAPMTRAIEQQATAHYIGNADISVTALIDEPLIRWLRRKHRDTLERDYSDNLYILEGAISDDILSRNPQEDEIVHYRGEIIVNGWRVSGELDWCGPDPLNEGWFALEDWKKSSHSLVDNERRLADYEAQLNIYLEILRVNKPDIAEKVKRLRIFLWNRDYNQYKKYPPAEYIKMKIWSRDRVREYLSERVKYHQEWSGLETAPPMCDEHHRWATKPVWAVMKKGRKSAMKLHDNEADAEAHAAKDESYSVEYRPAESKRCSDYCDYNKANLCPWVGGGQLLA